MAKALKILSTLMLIIMTIVDAQDNAIVATLANCLRVTGYYFCNPNNESTNPTAAAYEGYGYCCAEGSTAENC